MKNRWVLAGYAVGLLLTGLARGQTLIYPEPPTGALISDTYFSFNDEMASGALWDEGSQEFFYRDFAIVLFYAGSGVAQVEVRLTDDMGLDHRYEIDNLGVPLMIDGTGSKKTIMLNVAGVAFPVSNEEYEYHPDITVEIFATESIFVLPPSYFSTIGHGRTVKEAEETGWQQFGFSIPLLSMERFQYLPYAIFWRNLRAFPDGWDTKITIANPASHGILIRLHYFPDYQKEYDPDTCTGMDVMPPWPQDLYLNAGETRIFYLHEMLGATLESHYQTEGSVGIESVRYDPFRGRWEGSELEIALEVVPLSGGVRICVPVEAAS